MNIFKQHWDRCLLIVTLTILLTTTVFTVLRDARYKPNLDDILVRNLPVRPENLSTDFSTLSSEFESFKPWVEPPQTGHRLAISRLIEYLPQIGRLRPFDLKATDRFGIDREWKNRYGLSLADPDIGIIDSDGDGFLNLDEFHAQTDPTNPAEHPPHITKLRIMQVSKMPFRMVFRAYNMIDGVMRFQVNLRDAKDRRNRSPLLVTGDVVEEWKVGEFRQKVTTRFDPTIQLEREFDESELDLENTVTKEKVTLVLNKEVDSPESILELRDLSAGLFSANIKVRLNKDFPFREKVLKVVDIIEEAGNTTAIILDNNTGARYKITKPLNYEIEAMNRIQQAPKEKISQTLPEETF